MINKRCRQPTDCSFLWQRPSMDSALLSNGLKGEEKATEKDSLRSLKPSTSVFFPHKLYPAVTLHSSVDGWGLFWRIHVFSRFQTISLDSVFARHDLIGRRIRLQPEKWNVSQLLTQATEPTERMDPQCISRVPKAKSMRSVNGRV